jgi:hypothetical protein
MTANEAIPPTFFPGVMGVGQQLGGALTEQGQAERDVQ